MKTDSEQVAYKTFSFRVKDSTSGRFLVTSSDAVNTVWNYCNAAQIHALKHNQRWPDYFQLHASTKGSSKILGLPSQVVQAVCKEYIIKRKASHKAKLRWRVSKGARRSLGWIPFTNQDILISQRGIVMFRGNKIRFWQHRDIEGKVKSGNFSQDSRGLWYVNLVCEIERDKTDRTAVTGIDLGLKTVATAAIVIDDVNIKFIETKQSRFYRDLEAKLAEAQSRRRKRQVKKIHAKIANRRKDVLHKFSRNLVDQSGYVFIGNVSSQFAIAFAPKSALDVSWATLRNLLKYKSDHAGVVYVDVDEAWSTQACSICGSICGPRGREGLGIRRWVCSECGTAHNRDENAAVNISRFGCETLGLKWPRSLVLKYEEASHKERGQKSSGYLVS